MENEYKKLDPAKAEELKKTGVTRNSPSMKALPKELLTEISGGSELPHDICPVCGSTMSVAYAEPEENVGKDAVIYYCRNCLYHYDQITANQTPCDPAVTRLIRDVR